MSAGSVYVFSRKPDDMDPRVLMFLAIITPRGVDGGNVTASGFKVAECVVPRRVCPACGQNRRRACPVCLVNVRAAASTTLYYNAHA